MSSPQDILNMEHVYVSEATQDFLPVQIRVAIGEEDNSDVYITPQQMMSCGELNSVLDYLQNDILGKLKVNIAESCTMFIICNGITYDVEMASGKAIAINKKATQ